ncbi:MarR family winged helix-turn-helix transcriptional regulator [Nakamurella alba]|uniref:MarR family winged helix-turn-helix transcriptional regulator n=1 Tax=Nakamurella alba TaxID=2665158 RepID=UPI0012B9A5F2|nr:MarR family transcriptional regulator [Nakamurella alba]
MHPPSDEDLFRIERAIGHLARRVRTFGRRSAGDIHPGLSTAAFGLLRRLVESGPVRNRDLTEVFGIDKAAISRQLGQLVRMGLAERFPDPGDRRAPLVAATPDGARRVDDMLQRSHRMLRLQLSSWTEAEIENLRSVLERFNTDEPPLDAGDAPQGDVSGR